MTEDVKEKEILDKYYESVKLEFGVDDMLQEDIQEHLDIVKFAFKQGQISRMENDILP